ncbi:hypothetical protein XBP1_1620006 [Xenorhabdus bovienii str. puntauvense]|uniref:Uncharacterized protein n=1 Tax=Xenorhabdus bovienii str. puntauvense TaxID=1398201 RepID=A0A077NC28_XENBV|nr:hypothetical protein XBP1_1620006 [Xenorhabdus bovienii str. puntauvense]
MWVKLHTRITNTDYRKEWLNDDQTILSKDELGYGWQSSQQTVIF